jgi:hypothetical protein
LFSLLVAGGSDIFFSFFLFSFLFFFFFVNFGQHWGYFQVPGLAFRQAFYPLNCTLSPFCLYFSDRVSYFCPGLVSDQDPPSASVYLRLQACTTTFCLFFQIRSY